MCEYLRTYVQTPDQYKMKEIEADCSFIPKSETDFFFLDRPTKTEDRNRSPNERKALSTELFFLSSFRPCFDGGKREDEKL